MLTKTYEMLFHGIMRFRLPLTLTAVACAATAIPFARSLPVDMSFRPLFTNDADLLALTEAFESELGQESDSQIGVILQTDDPGRACAQCVECRRETCRGDHPHRRHGIRIVRHIGGESLDTRSPCRSYCG